MKEWRAVTLRDISKSIDYGYTASSTNLPIGPKFLRITDIASNAVNWNNVPYCNISPHDKIKYTLSEGDIVVARTGASTGATYTIKNNDPKDVVFASYLIRYRISREIACPFFIGKLLTSDIWKNFVDGVVGGSAQPGANAKVLGNFPILLPSLPEQRAIAAVLSNLDDKIDLLHRQNATLEAMAEALFKQWFVVEAKEDWEEFAVKDIAYQIKSSISPQNYPQENFYHYSIPAYDLNKTPELVCGQSLLSNKFLIEKNCVLISKLNPQFPRVWMLMDDIKKNSISSTEFISASPYNKLELPFIYCLFKNNNVASELARSASGTSGSHQRIKPGDIFSVTFSAPNRQYLTEFSNQVLPMFEHIRMNQTQIQTLEKLRDTLLPKLMSGEVRVEY